jgi:hypothetical protein
MVYLHSFTSFIDIVKKIKDLFEMCTTQNKIWFLFGAKIERKSNQVEWNIFDPI